MKLLCLDLETTVQRREGGVVDNSPFHSSNKIVSAHWSWIGSNICESSVFYHKDKPQKDSIKPLQTALNDADVMIAHNAKYDLMWLLEAGFQVPDKVYCTMIGEYILARGQKIDLSLDGTTKRRNTLLKKGDLVDDLFKQGTDFSEMPLDTVLEYAETDVLATAQVYQEQQKLYALPENKGLLPVVDLMNDMLLFLAEIERNGIKIDRKALEQIEKDYIEEKEQLLSSLSEIAADVMGDRPINFNSGADMCRVIYSREVKDRENHIQVWNIGLDNRGKPKRPPNMSKSAFSAAVRETTQVIEKQVAYHCHTCSGSGYIQKVRKDGTPYKKVNRCKECDARGFILQNTGQKAGLKLNPESPHFACVHGFKTDKATIKLLLNQAKAKNNDKAELFLTSLMRLNAVNTYLDSFVEGIKFWTRDDDILHPNFNQCVTSTGRLSSTQPNFQNQPKGGKFPVRKCVVSRFEGGLIAEADFSGLEFRVAGELSKDQQIIDDIINGKDIHKQTASIINQCDVSEVTKDLRQGAKAYTFAPLYGGSGAYEPEHVQAYFKEFFVIYSGLGKKQKEWMDSALNTGIVRIPSGREYRFFNVQRTKNGKVTNATAIVNYPVQGFATADIVPLACIRARRLFKKHGLKSLLILTVHDSIVVDFHPAEKTEVARLLQEAMLGVVDEIRERFGYEMTVPLAIEFSVGHNWMDTEELSLDCVLQ